MLPTSTAEQALHHANHLLSFLSSLDFPQLDLRLPGHLGEAKSRSIGVGGKSSISMEAPMEIHDSTSWKLMGLKGRPR